MKKTVIAGMVLGVLAIAAVVCMPVAALDTSYPVLDNQVVTRQAHLAWQAAIKETEMNAAIIYVGALNGTSTLQMGTLLTAFKGQEGQITTLTTHVGLNNLNRQMQETVRMFLNEAKVQMRAGKGRWGELQSQMKAAVDSNANIGSLKNGYWSTRNENELANFDTRVQRAQVVLDTLKGKGYDTTAAQGTLDAIRAKRSLLEAAILAQDTTRIQVINKDIYTLSQQLVQQVKDLQVAVPDKTIIRYYIDLGNRAVARAEMINADLRVLGIGVTAAEQAISAIKGDIAAAQAALDTGDITGAQDALHKAKADLKALAQAYRDIAKTKGLSAETASTLETTAATLDSTAAEMGAA